MHTTTCTKCGHACHCDKVNCPECVNDVCGHCNCESKINDVKEIYKQFYYNHPFIIISENEINLKQVIHTNKCILHLSLLNGKFNLVNNSTL